MNVDNLQEILRTQYNTGYLDGWNAMLTAGLGSLQTLVVICLVIAVYKLYKKK